MLMLENQALTYENICLLTTSEGMFELTVRNNMHEFRNFQFLKVIKTTNNFSPKNDLTFSSKENFANTFKIFHYVIL